MPALYVALALFALLALLLVYRYDLYNREPWYMLALALLLGGVTMRAVETVEIAALSLSQAREPAGYAAVASVVEELARLAVVVAIAVFFPRQFDDPMDGIVYGSVVGLGMALEESLAQLAHLREPGIESLPVELVRLCGHLVLGGIGGFGVGMARMRRNGWAAALGLCASGAILLHFLWDWVALTASEGSGGGASWTLAGIVVMSAGMLSFGALVHLGSRMSRETFAPASRQRLWGWPFPRG